MSSVEGLEIARHRERETLLARIAPIAHLLSDPTITDISLNEPAKADASGQVWIDVAGTGYQRADVVLTSKQAELICRTFASFGRSERLPEWSQKRPKLECQAVDGEFRLQAEMPPATRHSVVFTIRKYTRRRVQLDDYVADGSMARCAADALLHTIHRKETMLIAGSTGAGKTTLINSLLLKVGRDSRDRILTIEDTPELEQPNQLSVQLVVQKDGGYSYVDAVQSALRHNPSYIVFGELRGGEEACEALSAWDSGHSGMATVHAGSIERMPQRLLSLCRRAERGRMVTAQEIADLVRVLVHVAKVDGKRVFTVCRLGWADDRFTFERIGDET
jgi:pilus assembly protein CpaF